MNDARVTSLLAAAAVLLVGLLPAAGVLAQASDDTQRQAEEDEFLVWMFAIGVLLVAVLIVLVVAGLVVGAAAVLVTLALVALGIVTSSAVYGLIRKRPTSAVKALVIQLCGAGGVVAGIVAGHVANELFALGLAGRHQVLLGGGLGLVGGVLLAMGMLTVGRRAAAALARRKGPAVS